MIDEPFYKPQDNNTNSKANFINADQSKEDLSFLQILPQQDPEDKLHYPQLAMVSSGKAEFLSQGQMSVWGVRAWKDTKVYFEATNVNDPGSKHLYVADTIQKGNLFFQKWLCAISKHIFSKHFHEGGGGGGILVFMILVCIGLVKDVVQSCCVIFQKFSFFIFNQIF